MAKPSALTEKAFAERRRPSWEDLTALTLAARGGIRRLGAADVVRFPPLYRSVCADLAAAEAARYSAALVDYLLGLTAAAHGVMYGKPGRRRESASGPRTPWFAAFPIVVRRRWRAMLLAALFFFVPLGVGAVLARHDPSFAFRVVPEAMLRPLAEAYARGFGEGRNAGEGVMMAGFYVYNNVGIALRCFALGIFGGLGSAFYLLHNGLSIGATLGYVASQGAGENVIVFLVGHGSLELGAIVLAGGSGLSLGWSLVAPGTLPRLVALRRRARELVVVVGGAAAMLGMAALLEAFWSSSTAPREVKLALGGTLLSLVVAYIGLVGRGKESWR
jgi:uncharacterized membrane protein SpoIIM required for sporulation